jgi:hypothetical protein
MTEFQITTEDVQERTAPVAEKWQLSPEFETGEAEEIVVTQIPQKRPCQATSPFAAQPVYAYAQTSLAATRKSDERIWLAVWICGAAALLISLVKALAA